MNPWPDSTGIAVLFLRQSLPTGGLVILKGEWPRKGYPNSHQKATLLSSGLPAAANSSNKWNLLWSLIEAICADKKAHMRDCVVPPVRLKPLAPGSIIINVVLSESCLHPTNTYRSAKVRRTTAPRQDEKLKLTNCYTGTELLQHWPKNYTENPFKNFLEIFRDVKF